ncbi:sensor histidine kinase [Radiobacillus deserti]|nr:HAMP domain-containing sensor histidine kinase [Radiobacillus deserti]
MVWQMDVGILYFKGILEEDTILTLFKLFRLGPTFSVPIVFFIAYRVMKNEPAMLKDGSWLWKVLIRIFDKKVLTFLIGWSAVVYLIHWTPLGIRGLEASRTDFLPIHHYFPVYGVMSWVYIVHMSGFVLMMIVVYLTTRKLIDSSMKVFLKSFSIYSTFLIVCGFLNFVPKLGVVSSSIGVVIFSTLIVHEFIKMNTRLKFNYYQLMERQKKLDYTGNLAGSLIHEVKNTNQIIKGFAKVLDDSESLTQRGKGALEMIKSSSEHLEGLSNNYKEYLKSSAISLDKVDLELIIRRSISFSSEMLAEHGVDIKFTNHYKPLHAYVNRTNLEQVFINMIKNSIEAMPSEREKREIQISTEMKEERIIIHLKDTGKGIPKENWESIFDPFISFNEKGMGLGLPFVKKTVIEHLGNIYVVESSAEGTHFQIELPQNGILVS